jgi:hypothetical protein
MTREDLYKAVKVATVESGNNLKDKLIEECWELIEQLAKCIDDSISGNQIDVLNIADEISDVIICLEQNANVRDVSTLVDIRKSFKLERLRKNLEAGKLFK